MGLFFFLGAMLGKRKAQSQLTPDTVDDDKPVNYGDDNIEFKDPTPEELAARPVLKAKRSGGQPSIPDVINKVADGQLMDVADKGDETKETEKTEEKTEDKAEEKVTSASLPFSFATYDWGANTTNPFASSSTTNPFASTLSEKKEGEKEDFKPLWGASSDKSSSFKSEPSIFSSGNSSFAFSATPNLGSDSNDSSFPTSVPESIGSSKKKDAAPPVEVTTGEEDEKNVYREPVKVHELGVISKPLPDDKDNEKDEKSDPAPLKKGWVERGRGELRLNVKKDDPTKSRIIVRRAQTHQLVINMPLYKNITCERAAETVIRLVGFNKGPDSDTLIPSSYLIRQRLAEESEKLLALIQKHIDASPSLSSTDAKIEGEIPVEISTSDKETTETEKEVPKSVEENKEEKKEDEQTETPKSTEVEDKQEDNSKTESS